MVEHPERVRPDQFSYEVLNRIFHRHSGPGPGTLKVGGLEVTKLCRFMVNTKKESKVCFTWRDPNGNEQELTRPDFPAPGALPLTHLQGPAQPGARG